MVGFGGISTGNEDTGRRWKGRKRVKGSKWARMPLLTIGLLGVQIIWSTEMGYASPYLLSLGLSKSLMSIVFVAGPLSGLFVQPLIGVLADSSTSRFGRRRPYMLVGSALCATAMLLLGFTKDVASWFLDRDSKANATLTIWLAVLAIYCIDFSINAVQAADRALLVDTLPTTQQERGNAWAGRMLSVGSVVGFFVGNLPLPTVLPFLGRTHLQVLCVITSVLLLITHIVTSISVEERVLLSDSESHYEADRTSSDNAQRRAGGWRHFPAPPVSAQGNKWRPKITRNPVVKMFADIYANVRTLPPHIRAICMVQFFSWIGWFPVLFFSTVWVGEIYTLALAKAGVDTSATTAESTTTTEEATLVGFTALLYSSLLGLATIIILPLVVAFFQRRHKRHAHHHPGTRHRGFHIGLAEIWAFSLFLFGVCMFATWFTQDSVDGSVAVIGLTGFCFAVSQWVPFSLLAEEILGGNANDSGGGADGGGGEYEALPAAEGVEEGADEGEEIPLRGGAVRLEEDHEGEQEGHTPVSRGVVFDSGDANEEGADERTLVDEHEHERDHAHIGGGDQEGLMRDLEHSEFATDSPHGAAGHRRRGGQNGTGGSGGIGEKAGIILGIHNVAIVIPQFLVTGLSSIIFALFEAGVSGVHPGAGHAGAGLGGVVDSPTASGAAAAVPTDGYGGVDPDIGFDEKDGPVRMLARTVARRAAEMMVARAEGVEGGGGSPDGIGLIFRIGGIRLLLSDTVRLLHTIITELVESVVRCTFQSSPPPYKAKLKSQTGMPYSHHSHSGQFCHHGSGSLESMVEAAAKRGFKMYALTEHCPRWREQDLYPEEVEAGVSPSDLATTFDAFITEANRLREKYTGGKMEILTGVETEHIYPEDLDILQAVIDEHRDAGRLDFVVGSVHHVDGHSIDFSKETFEKALVDYEARVKAASQKNGEQIELGKTELRDAALSMLLESYFLAQKRMMTRLRPDIIGHFSLPLLFTPSTLISSHPKAHALAIENIRYAISYGALFELSSAPFRKGLEYGWPGDEVVKIIQSEGGLWCLSDDAHNAGQVGLNYGRLKEWARRLGIDEGSLRSLRRSRHGTILVDDCDSVWEDAFWGK